MSWSGGLLVLARCEGGFVFRPVGPTSTMRASRRMLRKPADRSFAHAGRFHSARAVLSSTRAGCCGKVGGGASLRGSVAPSHRWLVCVVHPRLLPHETLGLAVGRAATGFPGLLPNPAARLTDYGEGFSPYRIGAPRLLSTIGLAVPRTRACIPAQARPRPRLCTRTGNPSARCSSRQLKEWR